MKLKDVLDAYVQEELKELSRIELEEVDVARLE